jgi:pyrophosphatase PpaX
VTPRAVLYDLDGTLIDSTEAIVGCFMHTFDHFGIARPDARAIVDSIGAPLEDQFQHFWPEGDSAECCRVYRERYATVCREQTYLLPGAREILAACAHAGLRQGFATSKRRLYAEMILEHLGVLGYFETGIGPDEVTHHKPHPEAVLKATAAMQVTPEETFFIGDTHYDVEAGKAAGARVVCVTTGYATRDALEALEPEAVYDTLDEVRDHVLSALGR